MTSELAIDDLQVGQYITVLKGKMVKLDEDLFSFDAFQTPNMANGSGSHQDTTFNGYVLRVKSIDLPYLLVEHCHKIQANGKKCGIIFDVREGWKFKRLSKEYVNIILNNLSESDEDKDGNKRTT